MAKYLTARGVKIDQPADRCEETAIHVLDPDGHVIEFVQVPWPPPAPKPGAASAAPTGGRALSTRLLHAGLTIKNQEAADKFYRDVLGFSEIWRGGRDEKTIDWINMRVPEGTEYLEYMLVTSPPDRQRLGSAHHLCLTVPDIQAAFEEATRRTPVAARAKLNVPNVGRNGRWQLNLFDPDGTRTELMEPWRIR
jgi:lactoylglutathione lyase